ncbi:hypothetical protein CMUS01_02821 [Colletotrichum musicola]|uniref:Uncharacterized protein n=1 Tax=Colletotrichum musicola TaxID=2175873 RepID=A0A8H6NUA9_9PEZI|nr:hypothetical protein CMUS01_02821 [Colletotrichum musicola]
MLGSSQTLASIISRPPDEDVPDPVYGHSPGVGTVTLQKETWPGAPTTGHAKSRSAGARGVSIPDPLIRCQLSQETQRDGSVLHDDANAGLRPTLVIVKDLVSSSFFDSRDQVFMDHPEDLGNWGALVTGKRNVWKRPGPRTDPECFDSKNPESQSEAWSQQHASGTVHGKWCVRISRNASAGDRPNVARRHSILCKVTDSDQDRNQAIGQEATTWLSARSEPIGHPPAPNVDNTHR